MARRHYIQDIAQTFKVVKGLDKSPNPREGWRKNRTRQDGTNLREKHSRTDIRKNSIALRVARPWTNLPSESRERQNVEAFKRTVRK